MLAQQPAHVGAADRQRLDLVERLDGRGSTLVVEHGKLAEDVTGTEVRKRDRAPVGIGADRPGMTVADHVARVAGVALAEDHLVRGEAARHRYGRDMAQLIGRQGLEDRHTREQPGRNVLRRHPPENATAATAPRAHVLSL
jgi:hypothetical protein